MMFFCTYNKLGGILKNYLFLFLIIASFSNSLFGFTVVSQNLWHYPNDYKLRKNNLKTLFMKRSPDVIAFQETWKWFGARSLFSSYLKLTKQNSSFCKTNNMFVMKEGMAIASRFKILNHSCIRLPHSKIRSKRYINISKIQIENREVLFIDVHLSPYKEKRSERVEQLAFIVDLIRNDYIALPVVLLGDFNQEFDEDFFKELLNTGFKPAISPSRELCSYCSFNKYVKHEFSSKIDFVFYSIDYLKIKNSKILDIDLPISDHFGVWAELSFK
jgi:endonuclease/exonuclease/phosphatase family metal-dependent hydrolase